MKDRFRSKVPCRLNVTFNNLNKDRRGREKRAFSTRAIITVWRFFISALFYLRVEHSEQWLSINRRLFALLLIVLTDVNGDSCFLLSRDLKGDSFAASRADGARVPHISTSNTFLAQIAVVTAIFFTFRWTLSIRSTRDGETWWTTNQIPEQTNGFWWVHRFRRSPLVWHTHTALR